MCYVIHVLFTFLLGGTGGLLQVPLLVLSVPFVMWFNGGEPCSDGSQWLGTPFMLWNGPSSPLPLD
jgi:hypothetical protein